MTYTPAPKFYSHSVTPPSITAEQKGSTTVSVAAGIVQSTDKIVIVRGAVDSTKVFAESATAGNNQITVVFVNPTNSTQNPGFGMSMQFLIFKNYS